MLAASSKLASFVAFSPISAVPLINDGAPFAREERRR
jgi:hypothetical protein